MSCLSFHQIDDLSKSYQCRHFLRQSNNSNTQSRNPKVTLNYIEIILLVNLNCNLQLCNLLCVTDLSLKEIQSSLERVEILDN